MATGAQCSGRSLLLGDRAAMGGLADDTATRRRHPDGEAAGNYTQLLFYEFNGACGMAGQLREFGLAQAEAEVFILPRTNGFLI
jgi:hypothetical protein